MGNLSTQTSETNMVFWGEKNSKYNHKLKYPASDPWLQIEWICSSAWSGITTLCSSYLLPPLAIKAPFAPMNSCHIGGRAVIPLHSAEKWPHLGYNGPWGCCSYHYYYIFMKCSLCTRLYSQSILHAFCYLNHTATPCEWLSLFPQYSGEIKTQHLRTVLFILQQSPLLSAWCLINTPKL